MGVLIRLINKKLFFYDFLNNYNQSQQIYE